MKKFSVLNTNIEIKHYNNSTIVKKTYKPNIDLGLTHKKIHQMLIKYIEDIKKSKINFPSVIDSEVIDNKIIFLCKYKGENILDLYSYNDFLLEKTNVLDLIISLIEKAIKCNLNIDPHPKNFVFENGIIYYVDFCPPLIPEYISKRVNLNKKDSRIVESNFNYFKPENLFYHLCGDFIDVYRKQNHEIIIKIIFKKLIKRNYIQNIDFESFLKKCKKIRDLEDERLEKGVYLF